MGEDELLQRVREMRGRGLSPKQIARSLGRSPADVSRMVRKIAAESAAEAPPESPAVVQCWVNKGWNKGLTIEGEHDWPVMEDAEGLGGLVSVIIARQHRRDKVSACCYLVDVYCLGVKNTIGPRVMDEYELDGFVRMCYSSYEDDPVRAPFDLAQHLVLGAVEYARTLGFKPSKEFPQTRGHLGEWSGPSAIRFGLNGKPTFFQGPYDDAARIMATLRRTVGEGNFHFTMVLGSP